ncbi:preprotein translocase subunit SecB [Novosphingobium fuchskuhlense]|uniref:Protein-export protein SecB n=1 Tax=Novosphingobium fuchskuhlense TaxID=1117702 RepID=A0A117UXA3_9SPHN|nr:protein-export chaperone SecB [Novosphingobium fuchskuhlense]KUR72566.1 preprotein translocase subunit SecB [Novosphingobium fuchskuhlense]
MAEEGDIITPLDLDAAPGADGPAPNGEDTSPAIGLISQYIKDLSVENPNAPESFSWAEAPEVSVDFNIGARPVGPDLHEIEMKITATSRAPQGIVMAIELVYGALIGMRNVTEDMAHPFLFAEGPRLVFPFARRIIADASRDAGFAPLLLEPIDFNGLYLAQLQQQQAEQLAAGTAGQA